MVTIILNNKGNLDSPYISVSLFVLAIGIMIAYMIVTTGHAAFSTNPNADGLLTNAETMFLRIGGNGFMFAAIALILFNLLGAFFLTTHPIFVVIDIIFMPISVLIAAIMSNAYESSIATLSVASNFPIMTYVMLHLPTIIVTGDVITAIAAYAIIKNAYQ